MRILGIAGSLRQGSHNVTLLREAASLLPPGAELTTWDGLAEIPPYSPEADGEPGPGPVEGLRQAIQEADAVLFATPEYNGSVPGVLKNAIDWASRPLATNALRGKPVAVIGATTGQFGAVWAQADLRRILGITGARVLDAALPVGKAESRLEDSGALLDPELTSQLSTLLQDLTHEAVASGASLLAAA